VSPDVVDACVSVADAEPTPTLREKGIIYGLEDEAERVLDAARG
jgi:hypothetical protein